MPLNRVAIPTRNYSSRSGAVKLLVVHTAEGATTYQSLGAFFQGSEGGPNPTSSHVGIDDTPNTVGEYVRSSAGYAWTQAGANPVSISAELCAFAAWSASEWQSHSQMLANCAGWLAEEAAAFKIPLVRLSPAQAQGGGTGVCQHADLGAWGGGHVDCGTAFPLGQVLEMAAGGLRPETVTEEQEMVIVRAPNGAMSVFDGTKKTGLVDTQSAQALQEAGVKVANVSQNQYDRIPNA